MMNILKHTEDDMLMIHHTNSIHILATLIHNNMFLLVLFSMNIIIKCPAHTGSHRPLDSIYARPTQGHTGYIILMPGPHRVTQAS